MVYQSMVADRAVRNLCMSHTLVMASRERLLRANNASSDVIVSADGRAVLEECRRRGAHTITYASVVYRERTEPEGGRFWVMAEGCRRRGAHAIGPIQAAIADDSC